MKYLLLIHQTEETVARDDADAGPSPVVQEYNALREELVQSGTWLGGQPLQDGSLTTQVRVRDGETLIVDGPLAETAEQVSGYFLVDCRDLDEAIGIAVRMPGARLGAIEVRPVWDHG